MIIPRKTQSPPLPDGGSSRPPGNSNGRPHPGNNHGGPGSKKNTTYVGRHDERYQSGYNRHGNWNRNTGRHGGRRGYSNTRNNYYGKNEFVTNHPNDQ